MIPGETEPDCFFWDPFFLGTVQPLSWLGARASRPLQHLLTSQAAWTLNCRTSSPKKHIPTNILFWDHKKKITTDIWVWYVFTSSFWDPFNKHSSYLPTNCAVSLGKLALMLLMAQNSCSLADKPLTGSLSSHKVLPSISHSVGALTFSCILHCFTWSVERNGVNVQAACLPKFLYHPLPIV